MDESNVCIIIFMTISVDAIFIALVPMAIYSIGAASVVTILRDAYSFRIAYSFSLSTCISFSLFIGRFFPGVVGPPVRLSIVMHFIVSD